MVRQWQDLFYGQRYSATVLNDQVDFVKVSEGMGAKAYRVADIESLRRLLKKLSSLIYLASLNVIYAKMIRYSLWLHLEHLYQKRFDRDDLNKKESTN